MSSATTTPRTKVELQGLRRQFKAISTAAGTDCRNYQVRVHRALSWYGRALDQDAEVQPDGRLIFGWIAFNALYGSWDPASGIPVRDGEAWKAFLGELMQIDHEGLLGAELERSRPEILGLLENQFLDPRFWRDPQRSGSFRKRYHEAQSLYAEQRWHDLLILAIERVYVLRGQIVHGAATHGSQLNRKTLGQCSVVLERLLPVILRLVVHNRIDDRWPPLCYPPIEQASKPAGGARNNRPR
ncbi:MAG TPA: hypothetical protein VG713_16560 [Pirellulales bacterium]|nr:hypothetical protein [Pirellulales bacterium]